MHHGIHHFHGTPVWGSAGDVHRIAVSGAGAFVSYVRPDQIAASIQHAQVVGIDNGAFSAWVRGLKINWSDFYKWLLNYYHHPKVAFFVIPDVVDGGERDNDALITAVRGRWPGVYREQTEMKKKLISGLFLMLWMALLIAAMVYPQGIFPVLVASGVWVACLLTWAVIPVALAALIQNGPLWQELRASLLKTITRKENVFICWVMRLLIVVSLAWTGWAITLVFYLLTVIAFWITRNQMAQQVAA